MVQQLHEPRSCALVNWTKKFKVLPGMNVSSQDTLKLLFREKDVFRLARGLCFWRKTEWSVVLGSIPSCFRWSLRTFLYRARQLLRTFEAPGTLNGWKMLEVQEEQLCHGSGCFPIILKYSLEWSFSHLDTLRFVFGAQHTHNSWPKVPSFSTVPGFGEFAFSLGRLVLLGGAKPRSSCRYNPPISIACSFWMQVSGREMPYSCWLVVFPCLHVQPNFGWKSVTSISLLSILRYSALEQCSKSLYHSIFIPVWIKGDTCETIL